MGAATADIIEFSDQAVDLAQKHFAGTSRPGDEGSGMVGNTFFARQTSPMANLAVTQQRKAAQVVVSPGMGEVAKQGVQTEA